MAHNNIEIEIQVNVEKASYGKIKRNYGGYPYLLLFPKEVKYEEL